MVSEVLPTPESSPVATQLPPTVLVVDDDPAMAEVLCVRLKDQGYRVLTAENGCDGLSLARRETPALVLLDLGLPDVDGLMICQELADSTETCAIPIIVLTGRDTPDLVRQSRAAGCHYFLRKPYDPNALLTLIRQAIRDTADFS
jgi:DNA-binding response OmpR family regulator